MIEDASKLLPPGLVERMEAETGARIVGVVLRAGGGASRQGAQVELADGDDRRTAGYLAYDTRSADPLRLPFFRREESILRALSGPLASRGVSAPRLLASDPAHLALLTQLVGGSDKPIADAEEARGAARDCVAQLAALHRIDPEEVLLEDFGDPAVSTSDRMRVRLDELRQENLASAPDPVLLLVLGWLRANVPADAGASVVVHGDAGPGNYLHEGGRVTALLDWELAHLGDPMEDLAQIWVRMLFQPFLPMADVFSTYEAAGGRAVDVDRVRYHRLYFQVGFTVSAHSDLYGSAGVRPANLGVTMMYYTAHMRIMVESLAELAGIAIDPPPLPACEVGEADRGFAIALDEIREVIAPRASDQQARIKAKALARIVKYWRARDRYAAAFEAAEVTEVNDALDTRCGTVSEARRALASAIADGRIGFERALRLCHARMARDTALMADAMGSLSTVRFTALEENR